ncbi:hypothetical protein FR943_22410 [Mycobacterium sp. TNTM28]|uniref:Uncharacterized protein n=1 Tax=[Mycobacterium] fortunisiensis TaxID=2600579 RepID=A0ABS6KTG5_9MYCO|nr:hypothetical protein [[Mycobacterium] fortunisiensis]
MSALSLPTPKNWAVSGKRLFWLVTGATAGSAYFIVLGILAGLRGNYLTSVLLFGFVTFPILMIVGLLLAAAGKTRTRTSSDATGFTVWPDKRVGILYVTGLAVIAPSALLLGSSYREVRSTFLCREGCRSSRLRCSWHLPRWRSSA